jgi:hypothetical protein
LGKSISVGVISGPEGKSQGSAGKSFKSMFEHWAIVQREYVAGDVNTKIGVNAD